jgi:hypothetical protein
MMRLTAERLQGLLTKKPSDLADIKTWNCEPQDIQALSEALYYLSQISIFNPVEE